MPDKFTPQLGDIRGADRPADSEPWRVAVAAHIAGEVAARRRPLDGLAAQPDGALTGAMLSEWRIAEGAEVDDFEPLFVDEPEGRWVVRRLPETRAFELNLARLLVGRLDALDSAQTVGRPLAASWRSCAAVPRPSLGS